MAESSKASPAGKVSVLIKKKSHHDSAQLYQALDFSSYIKRRSVDGLLPLLEEIWRDETKADHRYLTDHVGDDPDGMFYHFRVEAAHVLCAMSDELVRLLATGNLAHAFCSKQQSDLMRLLEHLKSAAVDYPSIYVRIFADGNGLSPTVTELDKMIKFCARYNDPDIEPTDEEIESIYAIDHTIDKSLRREETENGYRVFTEEAKMGTWIKGLELRYLSIPRTEWDKPFPEALAYTGFSSHAHERFRQHGKSVLTSKYNSFISAYFEHFHEDKDYRFHNLVVCIPTSKSQTPIAEIVVCALTRSAHRHGGLNSEPAGLKVPVGTKSVIDWEAALALVEKNSPYLANLGDEVDRARAYQERKAVSEDAGRAMKAEILLREKEHKDALDYWSNQLRIANDLVERWDLHSDNLAGLIPSGASNPREAIQERAADCQLKIEHLQRHIL